MRKPTRRLYFQKLNHDRLIEIFKPGFLSADATASYLIARIHAGTSNDHGYIASPSGKRILADEFILMLRGQFLWQTEQAEAAYEKLLRIGLLVATRRASAVLVAAWDDEQATASPEGLRQRRSRVRAELVKTLASRGNSGVQSAHKVDTFLRKPEVAEVIRGFGEPQEIANKCRILLLHSLGEAPVGASPPAPVSVRDKSRSGHGRTENEETEIKPESRNQIQSGYQSSQSNYGISDRSAPVLGAGGEAPTGFSSSDNLSVEDVRADDPLTAAQKLTGEYSEFAWNTLKKRIESGEQLHGREKAHRMWFDCLQEFATEFNLRARGPTRCAVRSRGKFLAKILERNGFHAGKHKEMSVV